MTKSDLLKQFSISDELLNSELDQALGSVDSAALDSIFREAVHDFETDAILEGTVVSVTKDAVIVDVGYKSEGVVPLNQFENPGEIREGDRIDVLLEAVEDEDGSILLSKRKADRVRGWEKVIATYKEGDLVQGRVTRKIKGGLLLEIGVPVFLPASQISIRRVGDVSEYIGKELECKIIKIDEPRMNIVVSRRKLLEEQREEEKNQLLVEIEVEQVRKGIVKNITDFGAFVDLGGIDGLLHITDMWFRACSIARNARSGSGRNMKPSAQSAASKSAAQRSRVSASRRSTTILSTPLCRARASTSLTISIEISVARTCPRSPTNAAAWKVAKPDPQANSNTSSPGLSAAISNRAAWAGRRFLRQVAS